MDTAPDPKDIQEFKFRRLCNLKLISSESKLDRSYPLNVVSTSNKFGVIFAGTPLGVQCISLSDVVEIQETRPNNRGVIENYRRREINLGCQPSHVVVNCSGDLLAVVINHQQVPVLQVFSVQSFGSREVTKVAEVRLSSTPNTRVLDIQWNPAIPNMIGCVLSDGSAMVCEFNSNGGPNISSAPSSAQATCLCWSPKGKQVVLGAKNGTLTQYKPDLKAVKSCSLPQLGGTGHWEIVSIHWLSTVQFIVVYKDRIDPQARSLVLVVNVPKTGQSFVSYDELFISSDLSRHEHYFIHIAAWNVLIISTGNAFEVCVLHQENESWVQWRQEDGSRAELPLTEDNDDVFTVGMALNTSATKPIPIGETETIPPAPFLLYMSEQGVLSIFHTMNLFQGVAGLCSPPQELPKQFFSVPDTSEPKIQPAVSQDKPVPTFSSGIGAGDGLVAQPAKTGFPISPFQLDTQQTSATVSPFQLSGATSALPAFGNLTAQLVSQAPTFFPQGSPQATSGSVPQGKPTILNVPKSQPPFGLGTAKMPRSSGSGIFGGSSAVKTDPQAAVTSTPGSLESQVPQTTAQLSTASQLMPKPQATVTVAAAPGITSASPVVSFQPAAPSPAPPPPKESPSPVGPPPVDDSMIMSEIIKEVESVKSLLANFKLKSASVDKLENDKTTFPHIRIKLHDLEEFEEELRETTASQQAEVNALKISLVEMCSCLENIKAKQRQSTSQRYLEVLESRELDPVLKKMLKNIEQTTLYVETKLKEATHHLNVTWEKQKEPGSLKNFDIPNMEAIYQIIATNMKILAVQQSRVAELENRLANALKLRKKTTSRVLTESNLQWNSNYWSSLDSSKQNTQLEKLADKLLKTRIDSSVETSHSIKDTSNRYFAMANLRKELPKEKEAMLWKWLKSHKVIHSKVARPSMPDNDVLNRSFAKSTPSKSPISIAETPLVNPAKVVSRNLFSIHAAPECSDGPSIVTSTPLVSRTSEIKSSESFPTPSFESPSISIKPVETKLPSQIAVKSVFSSGFGGASAGAKEASFTNTSANSAFNVSPLQTAPKVESSLFLSPQTPQRPKDSPKTTVVGNTMIPAFEIKSSPVSVSKSTTSPIVISSSSTVTVSEKDKAPSSTTTASSIFGASAFGQSTAFTGFGSSIAGGTTQSSSGTTISFSTGISTTAPATTAPPTTTSSYSFSSFPTSNQNLFSGSGFSFGPAAKPNSTTSSAAPTPSVSIFSLPSTAASSTATSSMLSGLLSSTTSSSIFPGFGTALSSSATPTVTVMSVPKTVPQPTPVTEISSDVAPGAPVSQTIATTVSFTPAVTTEPAPSITAPATTSAPSVPQATAPATTSSTSKSPFDGLTLTQVAPAPSFGTQAFQTTQPTTSATTSASLSFGGTTLSEPSSFASTTSQSFTLPTTTAGLFSGATTTTTASLFGGSAATTTSSALFQTPPKSVTSFSGGSLFGTPTTSTQAFGTPTTSASAFGTPTTAASLGTPTTFPFGTPTTSAPPAFGTPTSVIQPTFGTPTSSAPSVFGTPTTSAQPVFGSPAPTAQSPFGSQTAVPAFSATSTSSSIFGAPTTTSSTNIFGAVNALSNTSFFSSPTTTSSGFGTQPSGLFGGASSFSTPSTSSSSIFGAKICSPDADQAPANTSNPFGSPFGQKTPTAGATFGGTQSFGSFKPSTPGGGGFGSTGGSLFGGGSSVPTFGQPTQQSNMFQPAGSAPSVFGSPAQSPNTFSSGGQSIQQTGFSNFGSPQQQQPRPFGASGGSVFGGQAAFGASPTFGGTATFGGSPTNKVFGAATPAPAFGAPTQQSSTFENLAAQNTVSFGNLAQTPPAFGGGSTFGQTQQQPQLQQQQQQQPAAFSNTPAFGGSSFSSWR